MKARSKSKAGNPPRQNTMCVKSSQGFLFLREMIWTRHNANAIKCVIPEKSWQRFLNFASECGRKLRQKIPRRLWHGNFNCRFGR